MANLLLVLLLSFPNQMAAPPQDEPVEQDGICVTPDVAELFGACDSSKDCGELMDKECAKTNPETGRSRGGVSSSHFDRTSDRPCTATCQDGSFIYVPRANCGVTPPMPKPTA